MAGPENAGVDKQTAIAAIAGSVIVGAVLGIGIVLGTAGDGLDTVEWFQGAAAVAAVAGLWAAATGALSIRQQVVDDSRRRLIDRSIGVNERLSSWEFSEHIQVVSAWARVPEAKQKDKWAAYNADNDDAKMVRRHINIVCNTFDELGLRYQQRVVDKELIQEFLGYMSLLMYEDTKWMIPYRKERAPEWAGNTHWEAMNVDLKTTRKARGLKVPGEDDD